MSGRPWSDAELNTLDTLWGRFDAKIVAGQLGRSERAVTVMASRRMREHERVDAARIQRDGFTLNNGAAA